MEDRLVAKPRESISAKLMALPAVPLKELKRQWQSLYGSVPPLRISRELLIRAVAYRIQEQAFGGLNPSTRRLLARLAQDVRNGSPLKLLARAPALAGAVLMREWQGITHEVRILDRGVLFNRTRYRSLSEVARRRWAGSRSTCYYRSPNSSVR